MRGKNALTNTTMCLLEEIIAVICGFIVPKLILVAFGSKYNGLINSITQFLSYSSILSFGIGGVTRAALYKPLSQKNSVAINSIMKATDLFMKKIGLILGGGIFLFSVVYPFFVSEEFEWLFTFTLFLVIGINTFVKSIWGTTYLILLQADQKLWVVSGLRILSYILNTIVIAILVSLNVSVHVVKLGSTLALICYPIVLRIYVQKKYNINSDVKPDNSAISQRWEAFWHQAANFIMSNTDIMVLTVFSNMLEVSVYSVYIMVTNGLKKLVFTLSNGLEAAFGDMIAKRENAVLKENLSLIEWIMFSMSTIVYTCATTLILPFIKIYTSGVTDVDYIRPTFAYILILAQFFNCIRIPYQMVVQAAGHYKQTRNGAIFEAIINISLSILMVIRYGLIGVAIGTLAATVFRTIQYSYYACNKIVERSQWNTLFRIILSFTQGFIVIVIINKLELPQPHSYYGWFINALITLLISCVIVGIGSVLFNKDDMKLFLYKMQGVFCTKK